MRSSSRHESTTTSVSEPQRGAGVCACHTRRVPTNHLATASNLHPDTHCLNLNQANHRTTSARTGTHATLSHGNSGMNASLGAACTLGNLLACRPVTARQQQTAHKEAPGVWVAHTSQSPHTRQLQACRCPTHHSVRRPVSA